MKFFLSGIVVLLFLGACSPSSPIEKEEKIPREIKEYFRASADGSWGKVCRLLGGEEKDRIESALRLPCQRALAARGESLQGTARSARLGKIEKRGSLWRVAIQNPTGEIWLQDKRIYFSRP